MLDKGTVLDQFLYRYSIKLFILLSSQVFLSLGGFSLGRFFFRQCQEDTVYCFLGDSLYPPKGYL